MGLLSVVGATVLDRAVTAPIRDGSQRGVRNRMPISPAIQHDRLKRRYPIEAARRHGTRWATDRLAHRRKMRVPAEAHVDAIISVPDLDKGGVEIEIEANGNL